MKFLYPRISAIKGIIKDYELFLEKNENNCNDCNFEQITQLTLKNISVICNLKGDKNV